MSTHSKGAVLSKAHALFGHRLTEDDYRQMARMHSVREVVSFLKDNTYFEETLAGVQENFVPRAQIEQLLQQDLFKRNESLSRYASPLPKNSVYDFYRWNQEILVVLLAIRQVNINNMKTYISNLPGYLVGKLSFDVMSLSTAKNQDDLCRLLAKTPYQKLVEDEPRHADGRFRVSWCEASLYQFYYDRVFTVIKEQYSGKNRMDLELIFQRQVENLNTDMIFRYKRYFGGDPETIRKRLIKKHDRRSSILLEKMINAPNASDVLKLLGTNVDGTSSEDVAKLAIEREKKQFKNCRSTFYLTANPDTTYVSYVLLGQMEVQKITRVLEGVFYMEDPVAIENMVI